MDFTKLSDVARIEFINGVDIPAVAESITSRSQALKMQPSDKGENHADSAAVIGSSIVSFVGGLESQLKQDVMDSVLFAQLAADKKFPDKDKQSVDRYKFFNELLAYSGWTTTNDSLHKVNELKQQFTMDQVALEILATVVGPNKAILDIVGAVLKGLASTPKALNVFDKAAKGINSGNFQILPCIPTSDGEVMMLKTCLQFTSVKNVTRVLFWEWSNHDVSLYAAANNATLNRKHYAGVRDAISAKLAAAGRSYIENIEL